MIKHLFKLIWNKKKQNILFLSEILISFLVVFVVFSFIVYYYQNYQKPLGFKYERVWRISYNNTQKTKSPDTLTMFYEGLRSSLQSLPQVVEVSFSQNNVPYSNSFMSTNIKTKNQTYNMISNHSVDAGYKKVWQIEMTEGEWFGKDNLTRSGARPIIINQSLKQKIFGNGSALGKNLWNGDDNDKKNNREIIGVIQDMKSEGDYSRAGDAMYSKSDTSYYKWLGTISLRVTEDADAAFESKLYKLVANTMKDSNIEISHYTEMRQSKNSEVLVPLIILMIVAGFLIFNVALGLFGVLWYNISQRRAEIGLRRAIGASAKSISTQLVTETMVLSTLALVVGCFFALQFPLLNVNNVKADVYLYAIVLDVCFIYLLVFLCSLYPGKQAAGIQPAIALHEE